MKRLLPFLAFLGIAMVGISGATFMWLADARAEMLRFTSVADEATNRINARVNAHIQTVKATAAFFEASSGEIGEEEFSLFFDALSLSDGRLGLAGLGYAAYIAAGERAALEARSARISGEALKIWPETNAAYLAPVLVHRTVITDARAPGYDALSEGNRKAAISSAIEARAPRATEPVKLVRDGANANRGFLIYAPVYSVNDAKERRAANPALPTGLVFAGFRFRELVRSALDLPPIQPVFLTITDLDNGANVLDTYGTSSEQSFGAGFRINRDIDVAGQTWRLQFQPGMRFLHSTSRYLALLLGGASLVLASAVGALMRAQATASENARVLAATMEQNMAQKDLMLREMQHRIKNAIARILAIARQTAGSTDSLAAFTATFVQRLQSMSNAQDMLTRSKWQRADLRALLLQELVQVFGDQIDPDAIRGPALDIDEKTTQALGLTFHELATNALKYNGTPDRAPEIRVAWGIEMTPAGPMLCLHWDERGTSPIKPANEPGFGTKLIDANIRYDLGGTIARTFSEMGLRIDLTVPHSPAPETARNAPSRWIRRPTRQIAQTSKT